MVPATFILDSAGKFCPTGIDVGDQNQFARQVVLHILIVDVQIVRIDAPGAQTSSAKPTDQEEDARKKIAADISEHSRCKLTTTNHSTCKIAQESVDLVCSCSCTLLN